MLMNEISAITSPLAATSWVRTGMLVFSSIQ